MRPIRVTDEGKISRLFYRLSDGTVYKRWHHGLKQLPYRDILRLLEVDESPRILRRLQVSSR
jgi:hypothetical protein